MQSLLSLATVAAIGLSLVQAFPVISECVAANWDLGPNSDPHPGLILPNQLVYIQDPENFCINLPDWNDPYLHAYYYSHADVFPTVVAAEGYVASFCVGKKPNDQVMTMPSNGILSAHVLRNFTVPGKRYMQIWGKMNCSELKINCTPSAPDVYDDGGQYDSVRFRNCGKEPYSGVDPVLQGSTFINYVEQAGDGIYCMRVCEGGTEDGDPCNAKLDTAGCSVTMNIRPEDLYADGFTFIDVTGAQPAVPSTPQSNPNPEALPPSAEPQQQQPVPISPQVQFCMSEFQQGTDYWGKRGCIWTGACPLGGSWSVNDGKCDCLPDTPIWDEPNYRCVA
ncbi:hypothetical protein BDR26DRAFT_1004918 [Obelidium mucronatum]|nr:hypothetical protein BDR26DRAFT_1004918 [Obelidium mucronatum]